jgi:RNA polymerase sigma-70 factor, ECF subfamily
VAELGLKRGKIQGIVPAEQSDAEVIRTSIGEPTRFETIFDRHFTPVLAYACRRTGRDVGEDIAAETFTVAFAQRKKFNPARSSALPWLLGIATNLMRRQARWERAQLAAVGRQAAQQKLLDNEDNVVEALDARASLSTMSRALASLRQGDRDALLLHGWADLSYEQISEALGVPIGTVRSRIHRARRRLREPRPGETAIPDEGPGRWMNERRGGG